MAAFLAFGLLIPAASAAGRAGAGNRNVTVTEIPDVPYATPNGRPLHMNIYMPVDGNLLHPAVVVIHGGGWRYNDRTEFASEANALAQNGFVAFAIDYRLAPKNPYPAAVDDVKTAVAYVRSHAAQYSVDPMKIGAFGGSAGGHLTAMLAMQTDGMPASGSGIAVGVSWSGPMDLALMAQESRPDGKIVREFVACSKHGGTAACTAKETAASPITYVGVGDSPLLFFNSAAEVIPAGQAEEMDRALTTAGVTHQYIELPGTLHARSYEGSIVPGTAQTVFDYTIAYLHLYLG